MVAFPLHGSRNTPEPKSRIKACYVATHKIFDMSGVFIITVHWLPVPQSPTSRMNFLPFYQFACKQHLYPYTFPNGGTDNQIGQMEWVKYWSRMGVNGCANHSKVTVLYLDVICCVLIHLFIYLLIHCTSIAPCLICLTIIRWRPYINHPMHQSIISIQQERDESREER